MATISRRDLIRCGTYVSACGLLLHRHAGAMLFAQTSQSFDHEQALGNVPEIDLAPRERLLFDFDWRFVQGHASNPDRDLGFGEGEDTFAKTGAFDFAQPGYDDSKWRPLQLPHDWAVELPFVNDKSLESHGFKPLGRRYPETSVGWYRRGFDIPISDAGRSIFLECDGAFRNTLVFCNGTYVGRNDNGYAPFRLELTDFLNYGGPNALAVRVDASLSDGWFYEGAGIYRHVWLSKFDALHIGHGATTVRAEVQDRVATLQLSTTVENGGAEAKECRLHWRILDNGGEEVASTNSPAARVPSDGRQSFSATVRLTDAKIWSLEEPTLYYAVAELVSEGQVRDRGGARFGVRTLAWDVDRGFSLNGKKIQIKGTCNHQDHAGVGSALPDRLQGFRLEILKSMGCNAVRTSHNCPTPEFVEACDRVGILVLCETRSMSSNEEALAQLETMIKLYRNSPSVFLWSLGNEEWYMQGAKDNRNWHEQKDEAGRVIQAMQKRAHELDSTRLCTAAINGYYDTDLAHSLDVMGFNYNLPKVDPYRQGNPKQLLIGTETASERCTRGIYSTDPLRNWVSSYDEFDTHSSVEEARAWWHFYASRPWLSGGFAWTGFDYRGEPSPYSWPSISSEFGAVDTCGYPKDGFFYYQSWWTPEPVLHLYPHWNWQGREGEEILVQVETNLESVELFLNGKSLGEKKVETHYTLGWKVTYHPGVLEARGGRDGKVLLSSRCETTGAPSRIEMTADRQQLVADGQDVAMLRVAVLDAQEREVPTADSLIHFKISGEGRLIGVGNGDPNCHQSDKGDRRSLFNGLAQAIVQATRTEGALTIEATSQGLEAAKLVIATRKGKGPAVVEAAGLSLGNSVRAGSSSFGTTVSRPKARP